MAGELIGKAKTIVTDFFTYWHTPKEGYYVPNKEFVGMSVGKLGLHLGQSLFYRISTVLYIEILSHALGIDPMHLNVMNMINMGFTFWFTMIRARWIDNSHNPEGRFRPFMKYYGIPTFLIAGAILWFPYDKWLPNGGQALSGEVWGTGYWMKLCIIMVLFLGLRFFNPLFTIGHMNIIKVMTPNSQERVNLDSYSTFIWSLGPQIAGIFYDYISASFTNRFADIRLYRYCHFPVCILGVAISYVGYLTTKERVVQSRAHVNQVTLRESFRDVGKNRNFWVLCFANWLGFMETNSENLIHWTYNYRRTMDEKQFVLANLAVQAGASAVPVVAPFAVKRLGKRRLLILCNLANIFLLGFTYFTFHNIPALVAFRFINYFFNGITNQISAAVDADVRDAQHYISGERIDGMFDLVGTVGALFATVTGFVHPFLLRRGGIYEGNGAVDLNGNKNQWFALREEATFDRVARIMIVSSVVGAVMNVAPLFMYDLTETKQKGMTKVLKLRAMFEDYASGILTPKAREECAKIVRDAREGIGDEEENSYVLNELRKYDEPETRRRLALAQEIVEGGYQGILAFDPARLALSKDKEEKLVLRSMMEARRSMARFFPDGNPEEPDIRALDALYETRTDSRREARELNLRIQAMEQERLLFYRATKPYAKAKRLLDTQANAARLDEIFAAQEEKEDTLCSASIT